MNEYVYNSHSHSPTKIASWLLLPHLPDGAVSLNVFLLFLYSLFQAFRCGERCEVKKAMKSRGGSLPLPGFSFFALLFTSQCSPLSERLEQASFCNAQLFINPNPNPETAFFQKKDRPQPRPHVLMTPIWICAFLHVYSPHPASHPHPVSGHLALWCIWKCLLFSASYIMMSAAINICHFNCVSLEKYCQLWEGTFHFFSAPKPPPPSPLPLPPSLRVIFWKVGLMCNLDPSDISSKIKAMHQVLTKN